MSTRFSRAQMELIVSLAQQAYEEEADNVEVDEERLHALELLCTTTQAKIDWNKNYLERLKERMENRDFSLPRSKVDKT